MISAMKRLLVGFSLLFACLRLAAFQQESFEFRVVATGLENPWEVTWGPDSRLWVTERTGRRITRVNPDDGSKKVAFTIPDVFQNHGQDGLLGMALDPGLLKGTGSDYVYVVYTYDADPGPALDRRGKIQRFTYDAPSETMKSPVDVITNLPAGSDHLALRLAFGPDRKLYLSIGDQGSNWLQNYCNKNFAQELPTSEDVQARDWKKYQGKILRLNLDGTIPADNPMLAGVRSHIYTYGHRNPQGLAFGPNGKLYSSEHGPDTDDEFNLIEPGKNYGWPHVAGFIDDRVYVYARWGDSSPTPCNTLRFSPTAVPSSVPMSKESAWSHPDFRPPLKTFFTVAADYSVEQSGSATIAPGGMDIYSNTAIPGWADSALLLSLKTGLVYRLKLSADGASVAGEASTLFKTTNRYRDIALDPNGRTIYLATDNQGNSTDASGRSSRTLANPGAIVAFTYSR
jgi:PQQ-dependent dehydrogenase (s-GDH family)